MSDAGTEAATPCAIHGPTDPRRIAKPSDTSSACAAVKPRRYAPPADPRNVMRPLRQGNLDSLCGVYAILNALRWAMGPQDMDRVTVEGLFVALTEHAIKELGMLSLPTSGIGTRQLQRLIKVAKIWLKVEHAINLTAKPIPIRGSGPACRELLQAICADQGEGGRSFILGLHAEEWHWSVLQGFVADRLFLFDSDRMRSVALDRLTFDVGFALTLTSRPEQT